MAPMTLVNLPLEVQNAIFEAVWADSTSSASSLAATSRTLSQISVPLRHRYLIIKIGTPDELARDVKSLRTTITGQRHLQFTRHLKLIGGIQSPGEYDQHSEVDEDSEGQLKQHLLPASVFSLEETFESDFNRWHKPHDVRLCDRSFPRKSAWKPLITVLKSGFSHLEDLVWEAAGRRDNSDILSYPRIAPSLISTLHRSHPKCRLHLRGFCFLTLHISTDPVELATVCSPCLHSLSVVWLTRDEDSASGELNEAESANLDKLNNEAAMRILTAAPNLKHFSRIGFAIPSDPDMETIALPLEMAVHDLIPELDHESEWIGFRPNPVRNQKASLESFASYGPTTWIEAVNLQGIRRLYISVSNPEALVTGAELDLPNLRELGMQFVAPGKQADFGRMIRSFIRSLPQLTVLRFYSLIDDSILRTIFKRHGQSLREFEFEGVASDIGSYHESWDYELTVPEIMKIGEECPSLNILHYNYVPRGTCYVPISRQLWTRFNGKTSFSLTVRALAMRQEFAPWAI